MRFNLMEKTKVKRSESVTGFTLVEVLLGLSIFSVIAISVYSAFATGVHLSKRAEVQGKVYREIRMAFSLITKDLENARRYDFTNSYPENYAFKGTGSRIDFIIGTEEGLKTVSYYLASEDQTIIRTTMIGGTYSKNVDVVNIVEESVKTQYLIREEKSMIAFLSGVPEEDTQEIIASNIKEDGFRFFFGTLDSEEGAMMSWAGEWQANDVPAVVRIQLDFVSADDSRRIVSLENEVFIPTGSLVKMDVQG